MKIEEIKNHLDQIKSSRKSWKAFSYEKDDDGEDANYLKRYALAIELQYCYTPDDKELIKFLLEQEVLNRRNAPFQGLSISLTLLSYLLATYREPEHVWLFEQAKYANFDTYCGYDSEFIFSAGIEATCDYLENHEITEAHP